jgi:hypothetical protein
MANQYTCENAREDIKLFFSSGPYVSEGESAFWRIMSHMIKGDITKHRIVCRPCWRYFLRKKRQTRQKIKRQIK